MHCITYGACEHETHSACALKRIGQNAYSFRDIYLQCSQNHRSGKLVAKRNSSGLYMFKDYARFPSQGKERNFIEVSSRSSAGALIGDTATEINN